MPLFELIGIKLIHFFYVSIGPDPGVRVSYKMEVLRDPDFRTRPLFRVTSDSGEQVFCNSMLSNQVFIFFFNCFIHSLICSILLWFCNSVFQLLSSSTVSYLTYEGTEYIIVTINFIAPFWNNGPLVQILHIHSRIWEELFFFHLLLRNVVFKVLVLVNFKHWIEVIYRCNKGLTDLLKLIKLFN